MTAVALIIASVLGFISGAFVLLAYMILRLMKNKGWDDSNLTNALRVLSHVVLHPQDFGKMWYIDEELVPYKRPFPYVDKDELSEVVDTRP